MAELTARDKKTLKIGGIAVLAYLLVFFGFKGWKSLESGRASYGQLVTKLQREQQEARTAENKFLLYKKLKDAYRLDPNKLPKERLAAETSTAVQNAAQQGGFKLGPMRETAGRSNGREISSIQFDGFGPLPAALALIHKIQTLGFPIVIESLQLAQDPTKPGMLKLNATLVILNFEQWKTGEVPNA